MARVAGNEHKPDEGAVKLSQKSYMLLLELADHICPILLVAIGFPKEYSNPPQRKELSQITFLGRYEERRDKYIEISCSIYAHI